MDGLELIREARGIRPGISTILVPLMETLNQLKKLFSDYGDRIAVTWYDFDTKEGKEFMAKKGIRQHVPLVIWVDGKPKSTLGEREVTFAGFPAGSGPSFYQGGPRTTSALANLVARSSEIGILKAVGWAERDVQKQLMGEAILQSIAGGLLGVASGYCISYFFGFLSIPVSMPWEINLMPAFARDTETAAAVAVRLPVTLSAGLTGVALALSLFAGALASYFMGRRTSRMKPVDILRRL